MHDRTDDYIYIYIYFHSVFSFVSRNFFFFIRSLFLLFFPHSYPANPPLVLSPRHCVHVCDYGCFQSEFVRSNKSCICSKRGDGVEGEGRGKGEKLQEFCVLSRFNLISTNRGCSRSSFANTSLLHDTS